MKSVVIAYALMCICFWGIYVLRDENEEEYSICKIIVFYLGTRIYPALYLGNIWWMLVIEAMLLLSFWIALGKSIAFCEKKRMLAIYLFQPLSIYSILTRKVWFMLLNAILLLLVYWVELQRANGKWLGLSNWKKKIHRWQIFESTLVVDNLKPESVGKQERFGKKDIKWMLVFMILFSAMVFQQLGSHTAPESYETLSVDEGMNHEIVLNFDRQIDVSKVWIYLGRESKREISFSLWDMGDEKWDTFAPNQNVESVFCWNSIDVNHTLTSLGLVLMKDTAYLHELVIVDTTGNRVLPMNAGAYPKLFDEQELFPAAPSYYYRTMYDEVYHGRTAYEFVHQTAIYENTHPPLGKSIIAIGIRLFGMNPFGWRVMCAICGSLMVPLFYWFAYRMFGGTAKACFTMVLFCTAFMNLTLSRIATVDIIVALFVVMMFYFMFELVQKLHGLPKIRTLALWMLLCGISLGLSIATKWTGVYAAIGVAIIYLFFIWNEVGNWSGVKENVRYLIRLAGVSVLCFIVIPLSIYVCSYVPFAKVYTDKGIIGHAIANGQLMLNYHANVFSEHPYSSVWYEWLIDRRPLWDSITYLSDGTVNSVATFGNPLLLWLGLAALFHNLYLWTCKKNKTAAFLVIAYISVVAPWLLIKRTVFIYQYFLGILILIFMLAYSVSMMKRRKQWMIVLSLANIALLILYFPVLTGRAVDYHWVNNVLELFESWTFA